LRAFLFYAKWTEIASLVGSIGVGVGSALLSFKSQGQFGLWSRKWGPSQGWSALTFTPARFPPLNHAISLLRPSTLKNNLRHTKPLILAAFILRRWKVSVIQRLLFVAGVFQGDARNSPKRTNYLSLSFSLEIVSAWSWRTCVSFFSLATGEYTKCVLCKERITDFIFMPTHPLLQNRLLT